MERVSVLFGTLERAGADIIRVILLLIIVLTAFVFFVYIYFGSTNVSYSSFVKVLTALFQFMNWWYTSFDELINSDMLIGSVLFCSFMIIVVFILLNMFVGFLFINYKEISLALKYKLAGRDPTGKKVKFDIDEHYIFWAIRLVLGFAAQFDKWCEKMKNSMEIS